MTTPKKSRAHPTSPPAATRSKSGWLIASLLVLAAFALYGKGLHYPLVFDDRVFRDDVFRHYTAAIFKLDTRWFAYATFGWTWEIVGKQWAWHRAINVLLHAGAAFMLFQFLSRLYTIALDTKGAANPQHTQWRWIAAMGALLFLVHPVAVYGVAYLTQRSIVMATLFGLLSLWLFLEGLARRQSPAWFYGAVATYFVAVFSKEHSVMIPAVALALTVLVRGMPSRDWRELLLPFALMGAIAASKADHIVLTSDNPRTENPAGIISHILAGMGGQPHIQVQADRAQAIAESLMQADARDVVLIAGKGHEAAQEVAGQKFIFSDVDHADIALAQRAQKAPA